MIAYLWGKVLFSDGQETILLTASGIGYQIKTENVFPEGQTLGFYISHVLKENSEQLFGFLSMREKKLFELLLSAKGVGPKGAYSLVSALGFQGVVEAVRYENKKELQRVPGIGSKATAQILLDLKGKIGKMSIYSNQYSQKTQTLPEPSLFHPTKMASSQEEFPLESPDSPSKDRQALLREALLACEELGFGLDQVSATAQKLLNESQISRPEQLVHLILKDM